MALEDPWQALSIDEVAALFDGLAARWWIAGGQAIDLFVGSSTRHHQDVDVAVLRPDQLTVQAHLDGWDLRVAHDGRLTHWAPGRLLAAHEHGIWARPNPASPWRLELLVDDVIGGDWVYRRNRRCGCHRIGSVARRRPLCPTSAQRSCCCTRPSNREHPTSTTPR
jgi:hypothetical protein